MPSPSFCNAKVGSIDIFAPSFMDDKFSLVPVINLVTIVSDYYCRVIFVRLLLYYCKVNSVLL